MGVFMKNTAKLMSVLSSETRLRILAILVGRELCCLEICTILRTTPSKCSRHLGIMKKAGLVKGERAGGFTYYALNPECPKQAQNMVSWLLAQFQADPKILRDLAHAKTAVNFRIKTGELMRNDLDYNRDSSESAQILHRIKAFVSETNSRRF